MKERISKNLGIPFVTVEDENKNKHFVCQSGVAFSEEEFSNLEVGDDWKPKYDYLLFKKAVETAFDAERE